jgi:excisionase family DNA binding protein
MSMSDEVGEDLLTLPEIAELLHVNPSTVRLWVHEERLPAFKSGGRKWFVRRADLEAMLEAQPHIGHPRTGAAGAIPTDWSGIPEQASMDLASSTGVERRQL